ncbi:bis(5'-nucleosyl)-tetraphosphatase PrpE [Bacillus sp. FJAT-44742]|uniref:bis(5'-nucleosyl)-tetraphosphatase PrpE n=1 Tax=Bacillus sp. FJAT-44742 TaxID=2014005 RepID=UPI000C247E1B|nr:bis(5'-nucleosyl)-tetraphosphatase PrpE [Bacillus sp. FJAT-44742]
MKLDFIGDIHGCLHELKEMLSTLNYKYIDGKWTHPDNRKLVFIGDLTDRGPDSVGVIELVFSLTENNIAYYVPGNHCDKLYRYFLGRNIVISHGLETTVEELENLDRRTYKKVRARFMKLFEGSPLYHELDEGNIVAAHAGIREDYIGRHDKKVKTFVLYGDITGEKEPNGSPVRRDWAKKYNGNSWIVYGHTPVIKPRMLNRTINIDTGCVFGGALTAFKYPEKELISVPSTMPFVQEKFREFEENEL